MTVATLYLEPRLTQTLSKFYGEDGRKETNPLVLARCRFCNECLTVRLVATSINNSYWFVDDLINHECVSEWLNQ